MNILNAILELQCYKLIAEEKRAYISLIASGASDSVLDSAFENLCNAEDYVEDSAYQDTLEVYKQVANVN